MPCPFCGTITVPGARFCGSCGSPLKPSSPNAPKQQPFLDGGPLVGDPFTPLPQPEPQRLTGTGPAVRLDAGSPSFRKRAWITLALYLLFWIPGLIANLVWWREAVTVERLTGARTEGKGCLVALFWVCGVGFLAFMVYAAASSP